MNTSPSSALQIDLASLVHHHAQCRACLTGWSGRWHRLLTVCERAHLRVAPRFATTVVAAAAVMAVALLVAG